MVAIDKRRVRTPPTPEEAERLGKLYISAFADASHCPRTGAYGWAFWIKYGFPAQTYLGTGGGTGFADANQAELEGCKQALEYIRSLDFQDKIIVLQCDNTYAVTVSDVLLKNFKLLGARDAYAKHVKGHVAKGGARHYMNNVCDRKAREQMVQYRDTLTT